MSCNGCRVLRKGCGETCVLRSCLLWIDSPEAQGNATLFLAKFFGRSDLLSFISAVPNHQRPALFKSLLFEACGRTVNPVNGAVGLLTTGNWHVCQTAVETVLAGGVLRRIQWMAAGQPTPDFEDSLLTSHTGKCTKLIPSCLSYQPSSSIVKAMEYQPSDSSHLSQTKLTGKSPGSSSSHGDSTNRKLLNLFV